MGKAKRRAAAAAMANVSAGMADVIPVEPVAEFESTESAVAVEELDEAVVEGAVEVELPMLEASGEGTVADAAESSVVDAGEVDALEIEAAPKMATTSTVSGGRTNAISIRKTIREGLLAGEATSVIAARVKELFPNSAAAAKSSKHIAYYKSLLRKEGLLPKRG